MSLEEIREENLKRNAELLSSFAFAELKTKLKPKKRASTSGAVFNQEEPSRRSSRLADNPYFSLNENNLEASIAKENLANYLQMKQTNQLKRKTINRPPRERKAKLRIPLAATLTEAEETLCEDYLRETIFGDMKASTEKKTHEDEEDLRSFVTKLKNELKISEKSVRQVTPTSISCLAFHPAEDRAIAMVGSFDGVVGFMNVNESETASVKMKHHEKRVSMIGVHPSEHKRVITTSYDGVVCVTDINRGKVREAYAAAKVGVSSMDFIDENTIMICQYDTKFALVIDLRINRTVQSLKCDTRLKTISVHPIKQGSFIATGSSNGFIDLWDIRKTDKFLQSLKSTHSVHWCEFSPQTGSRFLIANGGNEIGIYETNRTGLSLAKKIKHDNDPGRHLVPFRPRWLPNREDCFVVGSMSRDTQAEIFNAVDGTMMESLTDPLLESIKPLWVYHPNMNILAGSDLTGKIFYYS